MAAPKRGHLGGVLKNSVTRPDGGSGPVFPSRAPNANYYSDTPYHQLPRAERNEYQNRVIKDLGLLYPMAIPGRLIQSGIASVSDLLGGRKNLQYKKGTKPTKRETGK
jgi:hypothetical protein